MKFLLLSLNMHVAIARYLHFDMDIVYLYSSEPTWQTNLQRVKDVLGSEDINVVNGSDCGSLKNVYFKVFDAARTDLFVMIEADNYLLPEASNILSYNKPTKFWTTNKYGVCYEHGGIKILDRSFGIFQLQNNMNIFESFEVSAHLMLPSECKVMSEHRFDFSERHEWTTIAKELIKLYVWGHYDFIERWTEHEKPRMIFEQVKELLKTASITELFETLLPSLGKIYDQQFAK